MIIYLVDIEDLLKIMEHIEVEDKFILNTVPHDISWGKAIFVYQFFYVSESGELLQDKVAINILKGTVSICTVRKEILGINKSRKKAEYKKFSEASLKDYLGKSFVMKRRMIKDNLFLDKYIHASNMIRFKYMLEIEHDEEDTMDEYSNVLLDAKCVSGNEEYYNENMTIVFEEKHLRELEKLMELIVD